MLILGVTPPGGEKVYVAAAFPSACGKTNMAMMVPTLPGWKVETDRRRHRLDEVRRRRPPLRHQPRGRLLRRRARTRARTPTRTPSHSLDGNSHLHQRGAHRRRRHLVGGPVRRRPSTSPTGRATTGRPTPTRRPPTPTPASPPRPRSARRSPPSGRTRRACRSRRSSSAAAAPPTSRSSPSRFDWEHGVFLGSIMSSETTAAQAGAVGKLRFDPFAMLPFCGYNMGDYFEHWLEIGQRDGAQLPKLFWVNWFRKGDDGKFLWPGLRREQPGAQVGRRAGRRHRRRRRHADRPGARRRGARHHRPRHRRRRARRAALGRRRRRGGPRCPQIEEHYAAIGATLPERRCGDGSSLATLDEARCAAT